MSSSFNIQHCQFIALNGCLLILPASFLVSHTDLTDLTDSFSLQATGILIWSQWKNSEGVKIREIREIRVKQKHLTFKNYVALRTKTKSECQDARGIRQVLRLSSHHADGRHRRPGRTHG